MCSPQSDAKVYALIICIGGRVAVDLADNRTITISAQARTARAFIVLEAGYCNGIASSLFPMGMFATVNWQDANASGNHPGACLHQHLPLEEVMDVMIGSK